MAPEEIVAPAEVVVPVTPVSVTAPASAPVVPAAPAPAKPADVVAAPEAVAEAEQDGGTAEPYALVVPSYVPIAQLTPEREGYVAEFSQVAADAGLETRYPGMAQALLDQVVECASALEYQQGDEYTNAEDATATMHQLLGPERGAAIIKDAQQTVRTLGPAFAEYLDRTGLGNDPAVLVALAQANFFTRTPAQAQIELDATMQTKGYLAGDKLMVLKVHALSRIANRGETDTSAKAIAEVQARPAPTQAPVTGSEAALRAEAAALVPKKGRMSHEQSVRFQEITAKLAGGAA
jgi:hypothetical protein